MKVYKIRIEIGANSRVHAIKQLNSLFAKVGVDPFVEPFKE